MAVTDPDAPTPEFARPSLARSVFKDGAVYIIAGALSNGIAFLLFPFFAHVLVPRDYGIMDLLGVLMTLVNLTVALEVSQGLGRHFAEAKSQADRRGYASTALWWTLACYTTFALTALIFADPLTDLILGGDVDATLLRIGVAAMFFSGLRYLATELLRWELRPKAFAVVSVLTVAVVTATSAVLVLVFDLGVLGAIIGQLAGFATGAVLAHALAHHLFEWRFETAKLRQMLAYSLPLVPGSAGVFLNGYADRVAIKAHLTLTDVGVYGAGYRLSLIVGLVLLGFQGALMPQLLSRHAEAGTPAQLARIFRLFCAIALAVLLLVSTFADELLRLLTTPAYYAADKVVPWLIAAAFFAGMYVFAPGLNIAKRTRPFAAVFVLAGLTNLALAFALVEPLGITGAALAFMVTAGSGFTVLMALSQRLYPVPHNWGRIGAATSLLAFLTMAGALAPAIGEEPWAAAVKGAVCAVGIVALLWLLVERPERAWAAVAVRNGVRVLARLGRGRSGGFARATGGEPPGPPVA